MKKANKKVLPILLVLTMVMLLFVPGMAASAADVSYTVGTDYDTFEAAIAAVEADAATITEATTYTINLPAGTYSGEYTINQAANTAGLMSIKVVGSGTDTIITDTIKLTTTPVPTAASARNNTIKFIDLTFMPTSATVGRSEACIDMLGGSGVHNLYVESCDFIGWGVETTNSPDQGCAAVYSRSGSSIGDVYITDCTFSGMTGAFNGYTSWGKLVITNCTALSGMKGFVNEQTTGTVGTDTASVTLESCKVSTYGECVKAGGSATAAAPAVTISNSELATSGLVANVATVIIRGTDGAEQPLTIENSTLQGTATAPALRSLATTDDDVEIVLISSYIGENGVTETNAVGWNLTATEDYTPPVDVISYYTNPAKTELIIVKTIAPSEHDTDVIANSTASYVMVIPELVDFGTINRGMAPQSKDFYVRIEDALLDFGANVTVAVTSEFNMKNAADPATTLAYKLFNDTAMTSLINSSDLYCTFAMEGASATIIDETTYSAQVDGKALTDPGLLTRAGSYSDTMVFVCEYNAA